TQDFVFEEMCRLALSTPILTRFERRMPRPAMIQPGQLPKCRRSRVRVVDPCRDRFMRGATDDGIGVVLSMEHLHAGIHLGPRSRDVDVCELPEETFASAWIGRRRTGWRTPHADSGHVSLLRKQRRKHSAE